MVNESSDLFQEPPPSRNQREPISIYCKDIPPSKLQDMTEFFKDIGSSDVNVRRDIYGRFAIHLAARSNNPDEINRLLSLGAQVDARDNWDNTALHLAAINNRLGTHFKAIETLLINGADSNARTNNGDAPLHYLVMSTNLETIELFLKHGADVNIENDLGETPFSEAIILKTRNHQVLKLLLDSGSDINRPNSRYQNQTALHMANKYCDIKVIKFLMKNGANVEAFDSSGITPLLMLVLDPNVSCSWMAFFLKYSNVNVQTSSGCNVMSIRVRKDIWKTIVKHIVKLRALGVTVNHKILEIIAKSEERQSFFDKCTEEILSAKSAKLRDSWISYFNFIVDRKRKLKNYAGNRILVDDYKRSDCSEKFPIYGAEMLKNMDKGIETRKLFDQSSVILSCKIPTFNPNSLILRSILNCLTFKDYVVLVTA